MSQTHQTRNTDSNAIDSGRSEKLRFPPDIYENINEFWEERAEAENSSD